MIMRNGFVRSVSGTWTNMNDVHAFIIQCDYMCKDDSYGVEALVRSSNGTVHGKTISNKFATEQEAQNAVDDLFDYTWAGGR